MKRSSAAKATNHFTHLRHGSSRALPGRALPQSFMNGLRAEGGCFLQEISLVDRSHVVRQGEDEFAFIRHPARECTAAQDFYGRPVWEG